MLASSLISMEYLIDYSDWFEEGGYCQLYPIKDHPHLGFKEFYTKKKAEYAYTMQKKLSKFDLAPRVYSKLCKLQFAPEEDNYLPEQSDWGYVTELAKVGELKSISLPRIQKLVNNIYDKTNLKFWDCHWYNIGLIKRDSKHILVCVDTGKESFDGYANAWGFSSPGPKCCYCFKYQCKCG